MEQYSFFDRDLSWLLFNERILMEAEREGLPTMERVNFLAIFSSNLDEFYRVRIPVLSALHSIGENNKSDKEDVFHRAQELVGQQQERFGKVLRERLISLLKDSNVNLLFNEPIPNIIADKVSDYFFSQVLAFLQPLDLADTKKKFFPENNRLYFLLSLKNEANTERNVILNIPSNQLPRFLSITANDGIQYIVFLDDIIRHNLDNLFKTETLGGCYSFKVTRDAELDLDGEFEGDVSEQIEKQLLKRDAGIATRFLHQPGIPLRTLNFIADKFNLLGTSIVEGGMYHNLKDLMSLPVSNPALKYSKWSPILSGIHPEEGSFFEQIDKKDYIFHPPYLSYNNILRFFNEAATDVTVAEISVTLYRVASDSRIVNALISAATNGKKVRVMVELKARFDEANNIKWAKKMKAAGVEIIYSHKQLKVHAKIALVKRQVDGREKYSGLLATGNFNESTAAFYTDHILMTANPALLREMELVFMFLSKRVKSAVDYPIEFKHLLVAQFNLQDDFLALIDNEIQNAKKGLPAGITIKLNNLEERILIAKLYDASQAGVKINMIVRSICCLIPDVAGMSENITITRIVDRYLEHGRIFVFNNNNAPRIYMGSADWMNRNVYRRVEVCFPVYDESVKAEVIQMLDLQLHDNVQGVRLDEQLQNNPVEKTEPLIQSQRAVYEFLNTKSV
ncbi:polyphosphate kinase 1 [Mucilaginibacter flavus]|uniref:polyphosphate kinase 1 n=1 Tax=Mucilaginibacter flavus TaxID=931504 RepID=UPI0025B515FD|nr:polyphosphate kinase 1 [Mucilaginibacter flavus]MDN3583262.1 polyphosphate kinase 1 [Mucilaginibacter flavus]